MTPHWDAPKGEKNQCVQVGLSTLPYTTPTYWESLKEL